MTLSNWVIPADGATSTEQNKLSVLGGDDSGSCKDVSAFGDTDGSRLGSAPKDGCEDWPGQLQDEKEILEVGLVDLFLGCFSLRSPACCRCRTKLPTNTCVKCLSPA